MPPIPRQHVDIRALADTLWAPNTEGQSPDVFAIVDCARDKRLEPWINNSRLPHSCLYAEKVSYQLKRSAPHIVAITRSSPLFNTLVEGWGLSWGIFAVVYPPVTMSRVKYTCRRMAKAEFPNGKTYLFRYYDPRILRVFLPTCLPNELEQVFGPVTAYVMESEDASACIKYTYDQQAQRLTSSQAAVVADENEADESETDNAV